MKPMRRSIALQFEHNKLEGQIHNFTDRSTLTKKIHNVAPVSEPAGGPVEIRLAVGREISFKICIGQVVVGAHIGQRIPEREVRRDVKLHLRLHCHRPSGHPQCHTHNNHRHPCKVIHFGWRSRILTVLSIHDCTHLDRDLPQLQVPSHTSTIPARSTICLPRATW